MKIKNSDLNHEEIKSIKDSFFHIYHSFLDEGFLSKDFVGCLFKWGVQLHITEEELKFISPNYQDKEIADQDVALEHLFNLPDENPNKLLHINHCTFIGVQYRYFYQQIRAVQDKVGFDGLPPLLNDLVGIRIFEPASKLRSLELLEQFFGISHSRKTYYRIAPACIELKQIVEQKVVDFAKEHYSFDFDIVFYDVTTLYFETFEEDELRKNGFSKDNKSQQPQILVALVVTKEGFPIAYEIFSGNTFEGHTLIPVIKDFIDRNKINTFTVVADAAMISSENIAQLTQHGLNYIVGARMGNLSAELLETVDKQIARQDDMSIRIKTELGDLICSYSSLRYRKDLYEMNKQIEKAKQAVEKIVFFIFTILFLMKDFFPKILWDVCLSGEFSFI
jgi:hypothetical protein